MVALDVRRALAAAGLDVTEAGLFVTTDGVALDVFRADDPFGRATDDPGAIAALVEGALTGAYDVATRVADRERGVDRHVPGPPQDVAGLHRLLVRQDLSEAASLLDIGPEVGGGLVGSN